MPVLKQLRCSIEKGSDNIPLTEYETKYHDGFVETFVRVPADPISFSVHLTSNGYIAPGLAMFVYMDGIAQCNRNRRGLVIPEINIASTETEIDFRVRQKEDKLEGRKFIGREWSFAQLNRVASNKISRADRDDLEAIGSIEVVVLRCHGEVAAPPTGNPSAARSGNAGSQVDDGGQLDGSNDDKRARANPSALGFDGASDSLEGLGHAFAKKGITGYEAPQAHGDNHAPGQDRAWPDDPSTGYLPHQPWPYSGPAVPYPYPPAHWPYPTWYPPPHPGQYHGISHPPSGQHSDQWKPAAQLKPNQHEPAIDGTGWAETANVPKANPFVSDGVKSNQDNWDDQDDLRQNQDNHWATVNDNPTGDGHNGWGDDDGRDDRQTRDAGADKADVVQEMKEPNSWSDTEDKNRPSQDENAAADSFRPDADDKIDDRWGHEAPQDDPPKPESAWGEGGTKQQESGQEHVGQFQDAGHSCGHVQNNDRSADENEKTKATSRRKNSRSSTESRRGAHDGASDSTKPRVKAYWSKWGKQKVEGQAGSLDPFIVPEEPLRPVPDKIIDEGKISHQIQAGKGRLYYHSVGRPKYIDTMDRPYAVFVFKYRSKEALMKIVPNIKIKQDKVPPEQRWTTMTEKERFDYAMEMQALLTDGSDSDGDAKSRSTTRTIRSKKSNKSKAASQGWGNDTNKNDKPNDDNWGNDSKNNNQVNDWQNNNNDKNDKPNDWSDHRPSDDNNDNNAAAWGNTNNSPADNKDDAPQGDW